MTDDENEDSFTVDDCLEKARNYNAFFFKVPDVDAMMVLNKGKSRITLAHSFLNSYVHWELKDGDALAQKLAKVDPVPLSDNVSIKITADAIYFSCSDGSRYKLRRAALRAWMTQEYGGQFPHIEHA